MKKILLILGLLVITSNSTAQKSDSVNIQLMNVKIDSLTFALNKLQQDYDYLHCNYTLQEEVLSIGDYINGLKSDINAVLINIYHSNFDRKLYKSYKDNYYSSCELYNAHKEKVTALLEFASLQIESCSFPYYKINIINNICKTLQSGLNQAELSLDYYKLVIDLYKDE